MEQLMIAVLACGLITCGVIAFSFFWIAEAIFCFIYNYVQNRRHKK